MANDFSGSVWYIDTPMAVPYKAQVHVKSISWASMGSGDQLTIKDQVGRIVYDITASAANESINPPALSWINGLQVTSVGAGHVQISVNK